MTATADSKVVIITGAAQGIGRVVAGGFARMDQRVALAGSYLTSMAGSFFTEERCHKRV